MVYHPEVDEIVLIERLRDPDCFKAKITVVSNDGETIKFRRVDVVDAVEETCSAQWIVWSENPEKNSELQSELAEQMDNFGCLDPDAFLED